jgi:hypothetical protein
MFSNHIFQSFSIFQDSLSSLDVGGGQSGSWLWYMSRQGYLRHIIESLVLEDQQLAQLVIFVQIKS